MDILHYSKDDLLFIINETKCEIYNLKYKLEKEIKKWKTSIEEVKKLKDEIYKEMKNLEYYELCLSCYEEDFEIRKKNYNSISYNSISFKNSYNPPSFIDEEEI
jgi:hypothetical protein